MVLFLFFVFCFFPAFKSTLEVFSDDFENIFEWKAEKSVSASVFFGSVSREPRAGIH